MAVLTKFTTISVRNPIQTAVIRTPNPVSRKRSAVSSSGFDAMPEPKAALVYEARVFLAQRLRAYYDDIRQIPVPEALSNLLKKIEQKTNQEHRTSS
jgi:hypothetical protein